MNDFYELWHRQYKYPYPRGGLRLYPTLASRRGEQSLSSVDEVEEFTKLRKDVFLNLFSEDQKESKTYDCLLYTSPSPRD